MLCLFLFLPLYLSLIAIRITPCKHPLHRHPTIPPPCSTKALSLAGIFVILLLLLLNSTSSYFDLHRNNKHRISSSRINKFFNYRRERETSIHIFQLEVIYGMKWVQSRGPKQI